MISFQCDYLAGCHPVVMQRLIETNLDETEGYGEDIYCRSAREKIKAACGRDDVDVHFLVGGTQTNFTVIASVLRPYQGVLTAEEGHIACHETGAVEATGHKVLPIKSRDGKITAEQIEKAYNDHHNSDIKEHVVQPGMVYISFPTESGTLYSKEELTKISAVARRLGLPLFVDGARLGYGLTCEGNDLTLPDIARLCDVFYIGGTKCGAMFGEAVVISHPDVKRDFRYIMKQRGAMLAKGRLLGVQFDALFTDGLYFKICKDANAYALRIRDAFEKRGVPLHARSCTNQQFVRLKPGQAEYLARDYLFEIWDVDREGRQIVRFVTSWATKEENVEKLIRAIERMPE